MELNREQIEKALDWLDSLVGNSNDSDIALFTYQLLGILYDTCEELTAEYDSMAKSIADTVEDLRTLFAVHFGTYTDKDTVKIADVFRLLDQIAKEMVEGSECGG